MTMRPGAARSRGAASTAAAPPAPTRPGVVEASGTDTTLLRVEGTFNVTGPLETFANAGGVHLARALLAEFAENVAKLMASAGATEPHVTRRRRCRARPCGAQRRQDPVRRAAFVGPRASFREKRAK